MRTRDTSSRRGVPAVVCLVLAAACSASPPEDGATDGSASTTIADDTSVTGAPGSVATTAAVPEPTTTSPATRVTIGEGPGPVSTATLSFDVASDIAAGLRVEPTWEAVVADGVVTSAAATDDVVAVAIGEANVVIGFSRSSGAELWRYAVDPAQANIQLESRRDRIVVRIAFAPTDQLLVELDASGRTVWSWDSLMTGRLLLGRDRFARYVSGSLDDGIETRIVVDPDRSPEVIDEVVGAAIGQGIDVVPVVGVDGAVVLIDESTRERTATAVIVAPDIESIAVVDDSIVTYDEDLVTVQTVDGRPIWEGEYAAGPTAVELVPVSTSPPVFVIADSTVGVTAVDANTGAVLWWQPEVQVATPSRIGDRLLVPDIGADGTRMVLDLATGTFVQLDADEGLLRPTETGYVHQDSSDPAEERFVWFDFDGAPVAWLSDPADNVASGLMRGGVYLQVVVADGRSTVRALEVPG